MLPGGFPSLRESQEIMSGLISQACRSAERVIQCHNAPTATGKTLAYIHGALSGGRRAVILTHSKSLQDQILRDFRREVKDLRGAGNFRCQRWGSCQRGRLRKCENPACPYMEQFSHARSSVLVSTNYSMWVSIVLNSIQVGHFPCIVCDEAHLLDTALSESCSISLTMEEAEELGIEHGDVLGASSLNSLRHKFQALQPATEEDSVRVRRNRILYHILCQMPDEKLIVRCEDDAASIVTLWSSVWFRRLILSQGRVIVLTTATLTEKQVETLFSLDRAQFEFYDYPSPIPFQQAPVYLLPRGRMNHRSDYDTVRRVFQTACDIASSRQSSRGIIHTVSYSRAEEFLGYASMHSPDVFPRLTTSVEQYLQTPDGVLVSPSVGTGHDFPDELCRWQIVVKAPYPNLADPLTKHRAQADSSYMDTVMAASLVQICGRNARHEQDYGETFILDSIACRAFDSSSGLVPDWLRTRVRSISSIPELSTPNLTGEHP